MFTSVCCLSWQVIAKINRTHAFPSPWTKMQIRRHEFFQDVGWGDSVRAAETRSLRPRPTLKLSHHLRDVVWLPLCRKPTPVLFFYSCCWLKKENRCDRRFRNVWWTNWSTRLNSSDPDPPVCCGSPSACGVIWLRFNNHPWQLINQMTQLSAPKCL